MLRNECPAALRFHWHGAITKDSPSHILWTERYGREYPSKWIISLLKGSQIYV